METKERIIHIISTSTKMENVNRYLQENDDLAELGINSILFIQIVVALEQEFDFEFDDEHLDFKKFKSLNILCKYIEDQISLKQ